MRFFKGMLISGPLLAWAGQRQGSHHADPGERDDVRILRGRREKGVNLAGRRQKGRRQRGAEQGHGSLQRQPGDRKATPGGNQQDWFQG